MTEINYIPLREFHRFIFKETYPYDDGPETLHSNIHYFKYTLYHVLEEQMWQHEAISLSYRWDEEQQGFHITESRESKQDNVYFSSLENAIRRFLKNSIDREYAAYKYQLLTKDEQTQDIFSYNVKKTAEKLRADVEQSNLRHKLLILDVLEEFIQRIKIKKQSSPSPTPLKYKFNWTAQHQPITKFYNSLIESGFIKTSLPEFRRFIDSKRLNKKIIWLDTPSSYKAFIQLLEKPRIINKAAHLTFTGKNKWIELNEIFILKNSYSIDKIKSLKPPAKITVDALENSISFLDENIF